MILLVHWHPRMKWTVPQYGRTEGTVRVSENNTVNVTQIYRVDENVDHREITVKT